MSVKTYRHPVTLEIRNPNSDNPVQIAALKKLGYEEIGAKDIEGEEELEVTYEQVTRPDAPVEPPALPKLTKPIPPGPTRDESQPGPATPGAITREDVEGRKK